MKISVDKLISAASQWDKKKSENLAKELGAVKNVNAGQAEEYLIVAGYDPGSGSVATILEKAGF